MPSKQNCPHCGKKEAGYKHVKLCKAKNKASGSNLDVPVPIADIEPILEASGIITEPIIEPPKPEHKYIVCSRCGNLEAYNLNSIDVHCPKCGDYDTLALKLISMIPNQL